MKNQIDLAKLVNEIEDYDLDSIKEELKCYGEITLQIGYFEYDEEFLGEPCFVFDDENTVDDLEDDEYYDRYKSEDAGYGISLDKDLNVVYGYFISETFHDFKDARDDDEIKSEIYSLLDGSNIWESDDVEIVVKEEKENEIIKSTFIEGSCPKCGQKVIKDTKNQVAIKCSECGYTFWL